MSSRREQIVAAIAAAIDGASKPAGLTVSRGRKRPMAKDGLPWCGVYRGPEESQRVPSKTAGLTDRRVQVVCELRVIASDVPDTALDPYERWVVQAVMADPTLSGLAIDTQDVACSPMATEGDEVYGGSAVVFEIRYLTAAGDPAAAN